MRESEVKMGTGRDDGLDARVLRALEEAPVVEIPAGFASRVAAAAVTAQTNSGERGWVETGRYVAGQTMRYGRAAMGVCTVILLGVLLAFAPYTADRSVLSIALEWALCAQFLGLVLWMGMRGREPE